MKLLIIDNNDLYASIWYDLALQKNCGALKVVGRDSGELKPQVANILDADGFDGTILDIIFYDEPDGGIRLWESLSEVQRANGGLLMVSTKADPSRQDIIQFASMYADGRMCTGMTERHRLAKLQQLIDEISRRRRILV